MAEFQKVIKGLKEFKADLKPFAGSKSDWQKVDDALELLKAQEPVAPRDHDYVIYGCRFTCGHCHHKIWRNNNYCPNCGMAVKWE